MGPRWIAPLVVAACVHEPVIATRAAVGGAAPELRGSGLAQVEVSGRSAPTQYLHLDDVVETERETGGKLRLSIRDLLAQCPDGTIREDDETRAKYPACALVHGKGDLVVGRTTRAAEDTIVEGSLLVGLAGLGACSFACPGSVETGARIGAVAVIIIGVVLVLQNSTAPLHN